MARPELYVSIDIETDGPCPALHSMLSVGCAAFDPGRGTERDAVIATFSANLDTLPEATASEETMQWWKTEPEAWRLAREGARPPSEAIPELAAWLEALPGRPVAVAYPAQFDVPFVTYYLHRFAGRNPLGISALDVKSYAMAVLGTSFSGTTKSVFPRRWFDASLPHTHVALDDAIEQGVMFLRMRAAALAAP